MTGTVHTVMLYVRTAPNSEVDATTSLAALQQRSTRQYPNREYNRGSVSLVRHLKSEKLDTVLNTTGRSLQQILQH